MSRIVNYWMGVSCDRPGDKRSCLSWFEAMVPEAWGLPVKAEMLEDPETGATKQLRALFGLPDGALKQAVRRFRKGGYTIVLGDAGPGILRGFRASTGGQGDAG